MGETYEIEDQKVPRIYHGCYRTEGVLTNHTDHIQLKQF